MSLTIKCLQFVISLQENIVVICSIIKEGAALIISCDCVFSFICYCLAEFVFFFGSHESTGREATITIRLLFNLVFIQSLFMFDHNTFNFHIEVTSPMIAVNGKAVITMNWIEWIIWIQRKTFKQWKLQTFEWRRWGKTKIWKFQPDPYYKESLNSGNSWKRFWLACPDAELYGK